MKKVFIIVIIIVTSLVSIAQEKYPEGVLTLKWGDSKSTVDKKMHKIKGVGFYKYQRENELNYDSVSIAGQYCFFKCVFFKNQLYQIQMLFFVNKEDIFHSFTEMSKQLKKKYGEPIESSADDGKKRSDGLYIHMWEFKTNQKEYNITLTGNESNGGFNLFYTYMTLWKKVGTDKTWNENGF